VRADRANVCPGISLTQRWDCLLVAEASTPPVTEPAVTEPAGSHPNTTMPEGLLSGEPVPAAPARFLMRNDNGGFSVPAAREILWTTRGAQARRYRIQHPELHKRSY